MTLAPLDRARTAEVLEHLLTGKPSPSLVAALHDRTQGVPFFVEEMARVLRASGRLQPGARGLELGGEGEVPVPETVRDAVLLSLAQLSDEGRGGGGGGGAGGGRGGRRDWAERRSPAGRRAVERRRGGRADPPRPARRGRQRVGVV